MPEDEFLEQLLGIDRNYQIPTPITSPVAMPSLVPTSIPVTAPDPTKKEKEKEKHEGKGEPEGFKGDERVNQMPSTPSDDDFERKRSIALNKFASYQ